MNFASIYLSVVLAVSPRDLLVASVAIVLGLASLAAAFSGGRWLRWSGVAARLQELGGQRLVVLVYGALGIFLIGVGISLLR